MQRVGFEMKIHPEMVEEYKQRHDDIWPEMSAALVRTGWRNSVSYTHLTLPTNREV